MCRRLDRDDLVECAELGVSELVANAILHARAPYHRARAWHRHPSADRGARRVAPSRPWPRFRATATTSRLPGRPSAAGCRWSPCPPSPGEPRSSRRARWCGSSRLPRCTRTTPPSPSSTAPTSADSRAPQRRSRRRTPARSRRPPATPRWPGSTPSCGASCACCAVAHQADYPLAANLSRCSPTSSASCPRVHAAADHRRRDRGAASRRPGLHGGARGRDRSCRRCPRCSTSPTPSARRSGCSPSQRTPRQRDLPRVVPRRAHPPDRRRGPSPRLARLGSRQRPRIDEPGRVSSSRLRSVDLAPGRCRWGRRGPARWRHRHGRPGLAVPLADLRHQRRRLRSCWDCCPCWPPYATRGASRSRSGRACSAVSRRSPPGPSGVRELAAAGHVGVAGLYLAATLAAGLARRRPRPEDCRTGRSPRVPLA